MSRLNYLTIEVFGTLLDPLDTSITRHSLDRDRTRARRASHTHQFEADQEANFINETPTKRKDGRESETHQTLRGWLIGSLKHRRCEQLRLTK